MILKLGEDSWAGQGYLWMCVCVCDREPLALVETTRMNEVNQGKHLKSVHQRADDRTLRNTNVSVVNRGETRLKTREKNKRLLKILEITERQFFQGGNNRQCQLSNDIKKYPLIWQQRKSLKISWSRVAVETGSSFKWVEN